MLLPTRGVYCVSTVSVHCCFNDGEGSERGQGTGRCACGNLPETDYVRQDRNTTGSTSTGALCVASEERMCNANGRRVTRRLEPLTTRWQYLCMYFVGIGGSIMPFTTQKRSGAEARFARRGSLLASPPWPTGFGVCGRQ
jgi:hypothetical protein